MMWNIISHGEMQIRTTRCHFILTKVAAKVILLKGKVIMTRLGEIGILELSWWEYKVEKILVGNSPSKCKHTVLRSGSSTLKELATEIHTSLECHCWQAPRNSTHAQPANTAINIAGVGLTLDILALRRLRQEDYWTFGYMKPSLKNKR